MSPPPPLCLALYDVREPRVRVRMAGACHRAGLSRVQLSVYLGRRARGPREALAARLLVLAGEAPARIVVLPISAKRPRPGGHRWTGWSSWSCPAGAGRISAACCTSTT